MENYIPKNPYVLKSGKNQGKTLEYLLLYQINNFLILKSYADKYAARVQILNQQQTHLLWLVKKLNYQLKEIRCSCGQIATVMPSIGNQQEGYKTFIPVALCHICQKKYEWKQYSMVRLSPWILPKSYKTIMTQREAWKAMKEILGINKFTDKQLFKLFTSDQ